MLEYYSKTNELTTYIEKVHNSTYSYIGIELWTIYTKFTLTKHLFSLLVAYMIEL